MRSPCVKVCIMDPQRDACMGCARTLEEIAGWAGMREDERVRIMSELPARRERLGLPQVKFQDDSHGPEH